MIRKDSEDRTQHTPQQTDVKTFMEVEAGDVSTLMQSSADESHSAPSLMCNHSAFINVSQSDDDCQQMTSDRGAFPASWLFSARCNKYISRLCYDVSVRLSVRLSVTEVHWRIRANLGFKFRSQFTVHCDRGACGCEGRDHRREEWRDHLALC